MNIEIVFSDNNRGSFLAMANRSILYYLCRTKLRDNTISTPVATAVSSAIIARRSLTIHVCMRDCNQIHKLPGK